MTDYRLPWFLAGIACSILACLILASTLIVVAGRNSCRREHTVKIGRFDSKEAGVRAAIPRLATEIAKCPDAEVYRVMWVGPGDSPNYSRNAVLYERRDNRLGYEDDPGSSFSETPYAVDDAAIHAVAGEGGTLEDFAKYDQKRK
jgi:hypothetical protein